MERTEDEKITQRGYSVKLGTKRYDIKPLTLRKSLAWRSTLSPLITMMLEKDNALETPESLRAAIVDSPQQMADAVFSYLDLSQEERDEVLDSTNETELFFAFHYVMGLAFYPIIGQRMLAAEVVSPEMIEEAQKVTAKGLAAAKASVPLSTLQ